MKFNIANPESKRIQPPNYSSRMVQIRIFILVALLIGVLAAMNEARKPSTWSFLGFRESEIPAEQKEKAKTTRSQRALETRFVQEPEVDQEIGQFQVVKTFDPSKSTIDPNAAPQEDVEESSFQEPELVKAEAYFWESAYSKLSHNEKTALFLLLRNCDGQQSLDDKIGQQWNSTSGKIDALRQSYYSKIMQTIESIPEQQDEQEKWSRVLSLLKIDWDGRAMKGLQKLANQETEISELEQNALGRIESQLNDVAIKYVEDNSLNNRKNDMQTWNRLVNLSTELSVDQIRSESTGEVSRLQLYEQHGFYRAKVVTLKGTLFFAEKISSKSEYSGVDYFYSLWIRPDDDFNNLVNIYITEIPDGFPMDRAIDESARTKRNFAEKIEIDAFFYKKRVYDAQLDQQICPLLITRSFKWIKKEELISQSDLPTWPVGIIAVFAIMFLAVFVSRWAFTHAEKQAQSKEGFQIGKRDQEPDVIEFPKD